MEDIEGGGNENGIHLEPFGHWDIINMTESFKTIATIPPEAQSATRIKKVVEELRVKGELLDELAKKSGVETPQMGPIGECIHSTAYAVHFARVGTGKFEERDFLWAITDCLQRELATVRVCQEKQNFRLRREAYCDCFEEELGPVLEVVKKEHDSLTREGYWDYTLKRELKSRRRFISNLEKG